MTSYNDPDFDNVLKGYGATPYQPTEPATTHGQGPYGIPVNSIPVKPGLTTRGKAAMAIGTAVLATGGLIFWQNSQASEAAAQAQQQAYQLEKAKLDLAMLKEVNKAKAANSKAKDTAETQREKQIADCVATDKGLVGKQLGVRYSSVLADCQAQFPTTGDASDMQTAASARDTGSDGTKVNTGLALGGGVLVCGVLWAARRRTTSAHAQ
ncbi:hypothetical protein ABZX39_33560 [Streptomyces collinus]|uniref:hypothetical protein n=1 Tax=Streptomyces collinus TaxID=42684 RepID=UPI0033AEBA51